MIGIAVGVDTVRVGAATEACVAFKGQCATAACRVDPIALGREGANQRLEVEVEMSVADRDGLRGVDRARFP